MAQHFLHSKEARGFSLTAIDKMSDEEIETLFARCRWGSETMQGCPSCGDFRRHYRRVKRHRWRCAACQHEFSVTSRTPFDKHKLSLRNLLRAILVFEAGAKGRATLDASRLLGFTPKTLQALHGKIREVLVNGMDLTPLRGIVHMDGGYFCGKPRKPNRRRKITREAIEVRYGKRAPTHPTKPWLDAGMTERSWRKRADKRVVMGLCESAGHAEGSRRSIAIVCRSENEQDAMVLVKTFVQADARLMTDENVAFSNLGAICERFPVNHSVEYCTSEGVSDNMSETLFSRQRRAEYGVFHGYRVKYLQDYACETAWRESNRRSSQHSRICTLLEMLSTSPTSAWWRGYWQGHHRTEELGLAYFLERVRRTGESGQTPTA